MYHLTPCTFELFKKWYTFQTKYHQRKVADDQATLQMAIRKLQNASCIISNLSSSFNVFLQKSNNNTKNDWGINKYYVSPLLSSLVHVIHMNGAWQFRNKICELVNAEPTKLRQMTYLNEGPPKYPNRHLRFAPFNISYSYEESQEQLEGQCTGDHFSWSQII